MSAISRRFLQARTYLVVALLSLLLLLYISLLMLFTLWDRSEWAHENYADLVRQISRQEYFVAKYAELVPQYLCGEDAACRNRLHGTDPLPAFGRSQTTVLPIGEQFWTLRNAVPGMTGTQQDERDRGLLALGRRFAHFDKAFWGNLETDNQSFLVSADGSLGVFIPHQPGQQPDIDKMTRFSGLKFKEFQKTLRNYPDAKNADGVYWTEAIEDAFTGHTVFSCFMPFRDRSGAILGYVSTDISPDAVSKRIKISSEAFQRQSGSVLLYSDWGQLMLVDGRKPTPDEIALYKHLDNDEDYEHYTRLLQFRLKDSVLEVSYKISNIQWRVVYAVSIWTVLLDRIVPIGVGVLVFLMLVVSVLLATRRINREVIRPAALQAKRLADSENFNRTVVETSPVGLAVLRERDGGVMLQNAQFVPLDRWRLVDDDDADRVIDGGTWPMLLNLSKKPELALHLEDRGNGHFYQIGIASAMHMDEPVLICVLSDMTDRKRTQQALAEAKLHAESASAAKNLFLATISHEIRTPLYGMLASIELIAKTSLDDAQRQLAHTMDGSARALKDVLNDALDFTKGETEAIEVARQEFDLVKDIESVVQGFWSRASLKGLELHCLMAPDLSGLWWGDALKLRQVLNNLLNNAVKFTTRGSVTVTGTLLDTGPDGARIVLSVLDTGPGIADDDAERIFQAFGQGGGAAAGGQVSGTGLGLFICRQFAAAMGGAISFVSAPGEGSAFTVAITLTRSEATRQMQQTQSALRESRRKTDARVLIVDDQAINRLLLEKQLSYFGCRVTAAGSGEEALRHMEHARDAGLDFDLILTDLNMPGISGYALARQLRADGVSSPIMAVTAGLLAGERERCLAAGMNAYLVKPFTMEDLEQVLERRVGLHADLPIGQPPAAQMWQPEMMRAAVDSITGDLALLARAVEQSDAASLGKVVHRIHGGMAALDMRPAAALCRTIEESVEFEWFEEAFRLAPILQIMLEQIRLDIDPEDDA